MKKFIPHFDYWNVQFVFDLEDGEGMYNDSLQTNKSKDLGFTLLKDWFKIGTSEDEGIVESYDYNYGKLIARPPISVQVGSNKDTYSGYFNIEIKVEDHRIKFNFVIEKLKKEQSQNNSGDFLDIIESLRGGVYPTGTLMEEIKSYFSDVALEIIEYINN